MPNNRQMSVCKPGAENSYGTPDLLAKVPFAAMERGKFNRWFEEEFERRMREREEAHVPSL